MQPWMLYDVCIEYNDHAHTYKFFFFFKTKEKNKETMTPVALYAL